MYKIEKSNQPNNEWSSENFYKTSIDTANSILTIPRIISPSYTFKDSIQIKIEKKNREDVFYKTSNQTNFNLYTSPFYLYKTDTIYCYSSFRNKKSKIEYACFLKFNKKRSISLETSFSNQYDAGGKDALVDGLRGPNNYLTGRWQGFYGVDFESIVDLGSKEPVTYLNIGAIQDVRSWIWLPKKVEFLASNDGKIFKSIGTLMHSVSDNSSESIIKQFELKLKTSVEARYIKVRAENYGKCPEWHLGSGGTSWLFFDEITIL